MRLGDVGADAWLLAAAVGCAGAGDPSAGGAGDEIVVKHDNAFAENFDILTADGHVRDGAGILHLDVHPGLVLSIARPRIM